VSTPAMPRQGSHPQKPFLGLRRRPGRLALAMFRMPLRAYRHDAGWLLGRTFLEFVHTGRKTGRPCAAAANACARALVAPPQRAGGQAQYIERLAPESSGGELAPLRDWMLDNLTQPVSIDTLAERAHMSRRTLVRRFRAETGTSPMAWLTGARLDRARELLETTSQPVEHLGRFTGLGAPAGVRAAFHRHLGTSPQEYRTLFRHRAASREPVIAQTAGHGRPGPAPNTISVAGSDPLASQLRTPSGAVRA
jgi:AraC-like DNA-binding protein